MADRSRRQIPHFLERKTAGHRLCFCASVPLSIEESMYRSRLLSIALGLACSVSLAAQEGDKKTLRYNFEKGSTGHDGLEHSINVDASGQGQQMKQTGKVETFASFRVDE